MRSEEPEEAGHAGAESATSVVVESVIREEQGDEVSVAEPRGDELAATDGAEQGEVGFGPRTEGADLAAADLSATEDGGQDILDRLVLVNDGERIEVAVVGLLADGGARLHVGDLAIFRHWPAVTRWRRTS
jgi:hypothetical protein